MTLSWLFYCFVWTETWTFMEDTLGTGGNGVWTQKKLLDVEYIHTSCWFVFFCVCLSLGRGSNLTSIFQIGCIFHVLFFFLAYFRGHGIFFLNNFSVGFFSWQIFGDFSSLILISPPSNLVNLQVPKNLTFASLDVPLLEVRIDKCWSDQTAYFSYF